MIADLLKDRQFRELEKEYKFLSRVRGQSLDSLECVILDIETTGLEPTQHEITEIGAMKIQDREVKEIFSTLIKPNQSIAPEITRLTGIDNEMVIDAPKASKIMPSFIEFIGSCALIAHNSDFDLPFVRYHVKQATNQDLNNSVICTLKLARYLLPDLPNHKLHTVASHFEFNIQNRHRAMGDVELTYQIWLKFIELLKAQNIGNQRELDLLLSQL